MREVKLWVLRILVLLSLTATALAQPPPTTSGGSGMALLNLENTVALHGYDPVAYFTRDRAVRGSRRVLERVGGATYYFASWADRYTFLGNAPKYQPQFGGYCATSMAQGQRKDIDPENFTIFDGKLYLFSSDEARARFLNDPRGIIAAATHNYFEMARQQRTNY